MRLGSLCTSLGVESVANKIIYSIINNAVTDISEMCLLSCDAKKNIVCTNLNFSLNPAILVRRKLVGQVLSDLQIIRKRSK